jgi:hypothetical protein
MVAEGFRPSAGARSQERKAPPTSSILLNFPVGFMELVGSSQKSIYNIRLSAKLSYNWPK